MRAPDRPFLLDVPSGLPIVLGEQLYVEQVVRNFLSNAVKYTPSATPIQVVASVEDGGIAVRVIDAGPGLGDQSPDKLFDLFFRAPDAVRKASRAGIGLFVCRTLIGAKGGRVWAQPAPAAAQGAEFGLWLPGAPDAGLE